MAEPAAKRRRIVVQKGVGGPLVDLELEEGADGFALRRAATQDLNDNERGDVTLKVRGEVLNLFRPVPDDAGATEETVVLMEGAPAAAAALRACCL